MAGVAQAWSVRIRDHFRAHGRRQVNLAVFVWDEARVVRERARIKNLGLGGACVEVPLPEVDRSDVADAPRVSLRPNPALRRASRPSIAATASDRPGQAESTLLRLDATVVLEVTAPTLWDPLVLRGRVAWLRRAQGERPARAGVRFDHPEEGSLFALFQLLGAHAYDA